MFEMSKSYIDVYLWKVKELDIFDDDLECSSIIDMSEFWGMVCHFDGSVLFIWFLDDFSTLETHDDYSIKSIIKKVY